MKTSKLLRFDDNILKAVENFQKKYYVTTFQAAITRLVLDGLQQAHLEKGGIWPVVKPPVKRSLQNQRVKK